MQRLWRVLALRPGNGCDDNPLPNEEDRLGRLQRRAKQAKAHIFLCTEMLPVHLVFLTQLFSGRYPICLQRKFSSNWGMSVHTHPVPFCNRYYWWDVHAAAVCWTMVVSKSYLRCGHLLQGCNKFGALICNLSPQRSVHCLYCHYTIGWLLQLGMP